MAEDETEGAPKLPPDARLESLEERLDRVRRAELAAATRRLGALTAELAHLGADLHAYAHTASPVGWITHLGYPRLDRHKIHLHGAATSTAQ